MAGAYPKNGPSKTKWEPTEIRPVGKPRQGWQENVMEDLKKS
jgi:hypothetical protein